MKLVTSLKYEKPIIEITDTGIVCYCKKEDIFKVLDVIKGRRDSLNGK